MNQAHHKTTTTWALPPSGGISLNRDNEFTGIVPPSIVSLPNLLNVTVQNNKLQGPLPKFPDTVTYNLGNSNNNNSYCRDDYGDCDPQVNTLLKVAGALGYPTKLVDSWKGNDACNGWIFVTCDTNERVMTVNFARQGFSGTISPAFANLTSLMFLSLHDNNLTGTIPDSLASLPKLKRIDVTNNDLSGIVPIFRPGVSVLTSGNKNIIKVLPPPGGSSVGSGSSSLKSGGGLNGSSVSGGMVAGAVTAVPVFVVVVTFVSYKCYTSSRFENLQSLTNLCDSFIDQMLQVFKTRGRMRRKGNKSCLRKMQGKGRVFTADV